MSVGKKLLLIIVVLALQTAFFPHLSHNDAFRLLFPDSNERDFMDALLYTKPALIWVWVIVFFFSLNCLYDEYTVLIDNDKESCIAIVRKYPILTNHRFLRYGGSEKPET